MSKLVVCMPDELNEFDNHVIASQLVPISEWSKYDESNEGICECHSLLRLVVSLSDGYSTLEIPMEEASGALYMAEWWEFEDRVAYALDLESAMDWLMSQ